MNEFEPQTMQQSLYRPPAAPRDVLSREERLEDYLDQVLAPRVGVLPYRQRQEMRAEMRTHLEALIEAHEELGSTPEEAEEAAFRQFGAPAVVSDQKMQANICSDPTSKAASSRSATLLAMGLFGLPYVADVTDFAWRHWQAHSADQRAFYRCELLLVPIAAGLATGLLARRHAARGVLNALVLMAIPAIVIPGFFVALTYLGVEDVGSPNGLFRTLLEHLVPSPVPAVCGFPYWLGLGCLGAFCGGKLRTGLQSAYRRMRTGSAETAAKSRTGAIGRLSANEERRTAHA